MEIMGSKYTCSPLQYFERACRMTHYDEFLQSLIIAWSGLWNIEKARVLSNVAEGNSVYIGKNECPPPPQKLMCVPVT
jgi:hypothetical protein